MLFFFCREAASFNKSKQQLHFVAGRAYARRCLKRLLQN
jgi:hypothetical protein